MQFKKRDIVLLSLVFLLGISSTLLVVCWATFQSPNPPAEEITIETASMLNDSVKRHREVCSESCSQIYWLARHLEKTIIALEQKYQLEPIPLTRHGIENYGLWPDDKHQLPFIEPYEVPELAEWGYTSEVLKTNKGLFKIGASINLMSANVIMTGDDMDLRIANLTERLERLEPLIESKP